MVVKMYMPQQPIWSQLRCYLYLELSLVQYLAVFPYGNNHESVRQS